MNLYKIVFSVAVALSMRMIFTSTAKSQESRPSRPIVYPVEKQFIRLGYDGHSEPIFGQKTGDYAWVEAPQSVYEAARRLLKGDSKRWEVNKIVDFNNTGKEVVVLNDGRNNCLICLAKDDQWIRLNDKGGLPEINELLKNHAGRDVLTSEASNRIYYLQDIAFLFKGPHRVMLSDSFLSNARTQWMMWLGGKENRTKALSAICGDPVTSKDGNEVNVSFNMMTYDGGVEKWTVNGAWNNGLVIRNLNVKVVRKPGTFSYGGF